MTGMLYLINDNNTNNSGIDARDFFGTMMHDNVIYESANLRSNPGATPPDPPTQFETQVKELLYAHGDMDAITGFFDQWGTNATDWLGDNTTLDHRMEVVYVADADNVLSDWLANVADVTAIDTLIAGIDEIGGYDYLMERMNGVSTATLGPVDQVSLYTYAAVVDTTDLSEHHIYGSSRLGVQWYPKGTYRQTYNINGGITPITKLTDPSIWFSYPYSDLVKKDQKEPYGQQYADTNDTMRVGRTLGYRNYEITDHLGNVLATVLDRKTGVDTGTASTRYAYYHPDISTSQDYYPFGMRMDARHNEINDTLYRFGYNGMEKDNERYGPFKHYDFGARVYSPLIGRWLSLDPLAAKTPGWNPYNFANGNPIINIDPDGRFAIPIHAQITNNVAKLNKLTSTQTFFLIQGARAADMLGFAEEWHFDNKANSMQINAQWDIVNNRISNRSSWDYYGLGADLHSVQDFYSHSNYVELYVDYYKKNNEGKMPSSVPTYDEGVKDAVFSKVMEKGLKTGTFGVREFVVNEKLRGEDMGPDSHQQMNKDDAKGAIGILAKEVAERHSTEIVSKFEGKKSKKK